MISVLKESIDAICARITNVRYAPIIRQGRCTYADNRIQFEVDGFGYTGVLRGRNRDLILTDDPETNKRIALRVILDCDVYPPVLTTGRYSTLSTGEPIVGKLCSMCQHGTTHFCKNCKCCFHICNCGHYEDANHGSKNS